MYLKNIRSYINETIVFPPKGITCIYGDVGSGKTSVLMAISYALFGSQPRSTSDPLEAFSYPKAEDLLRMNESSGVVRVAFKHGSKIYIVERGIKRDSRGVSDPGGYLWVLDGRSSELIIQRRLTSRELKEAILEILGFKELYRGVVGERKPYIFTNAIYVPQFNISESITLREEDRNKIVNAALGLEKYVNIPKNIDKLTDYIKNSVLKEIKGREDTLSKQIELFNEKEIRDKLGVYEQELKLVMEKIKSLEERKNKLEEDQLRLSTRQKELMNNLMELNIEMKEIDTSERRLRDIREKVKRIEEETCGSSIFEYEKMLERIEETARSLMNEFNELNVRLRTVDEEIQNCFSKKGLIEGKKTERLSKKREVLEALEETKRLVQQGVCPTCKQSITRDYGEVLIKRAYRDLEVLNKEIEDLEREKRDVETRINELISRKKSINERLDKLREELTEANKVREEIVRKIDLLRQLEEFNKELSELESKISKKTRVLEEISVVKQEIESVEKNLESVKREYKAILEDLNNSHSRLAKLSAERDGLIKRLEELTRLREEYKKVVDERRRYERYIHFLEELKSIVEQVEIEVRGKAYELFREVFIHYFNKLMEGYEVLTVDVDQSFKPEVRIKIGLQEYSLNQPSGGQFISISLAYRLALNTLFRARHRDFKDMVLILDEPTVGFSPERVGKLRELLKTISGKDNQVIVVTHDRNLLEIGDCKVRLSLDPVRNNTKVEYEECVCEEIEWDEYKKAILNLLERPWRSFA